MASGISSPMGYSPPQIAGLNKIAEKGYVPLINNLGLTSVTPTFDENGNYVSPLTMANKDFYSVVPSGFGKKKRKSKIPVYQKILKDVRFLSK